MISEIRIYKLKKETIAVFEKLFLEQSLPMLIRWKIKVIDYGFSLIDEEVFYLIRNYESIQERQVSQDLFYNSEEWKNGPSEAVMNCIETYTTTVIDNEKLKIITNEHS